MKPHVWDFHPERGWRRLSSHPNQLRIGSAQTRTMLRTGSPQTRTSSGQALLNQETAQDRFSSDQNQFRTGSPRPEPAQDRFPSDQNQLRTGSPQTRTISWPDPCWVRDQNQLWESAESENRTSFESLLSLWLGSGAKALHANSRLINHQGNMSVI